MAKSQQFDVFLAHNSRDRPAVLNIAKALQDRGLQVWLDEWELLPGRSWQDSLEEALAGTKSIAVLVGRDGLGPWEMLELKGILSEAVDKGVPVIPVLLPGAPYKPDLPIFLQQLAWVDLRQGLSPKGLNDLQWGITGKRPAIKVAERDDEPIDLFLCFLSGDRAAVRQIAEQLKREQIRSWPDDWSLSPEESWRQLLSRRIQRINALAVFAGDDGGPWVDDQIESFIWELIEADQLVIPVILSSAIRDPKFPVYLRRKQIVDFRESKSDPVSLLVHLLSVERNKKKGSLNG
jgi:hypothetical protein